MQITKLPRRKLLLLVLSITARLIVALYIFWSAYLDLKFIKKNSTDLSAKYKFLFRNLHKDYDFRWLPLPSLINENASALLIGTILTRLLAASSLVLRINYLGLVYIFYWFTVLTIVHNPLYAKKEAVNGMVSTLINQTIILGAVLMMSSDIPVKKSKRKKSKSAIGLRSKSPIALSSSFIQLSRNNKPSEFDANQLLRFHREAVEKIYENKGLRSRSPLHQSSINFSQPVEPKEILRKVKATKISDLLKSDATYVPILQERQQQLGLNSNIGRDIGHFKRAEINSMKNDPPKPKKWKSSIKKLDQPPSDCYYDVRKRELKTAGPQRRRNPIVEGDAQKPVTTREEYMSPVRSHIEKLKQHYLPATRGRGENPPHYSPISRYLYEKETIGTKSPVRLARCHTNSRDCGERMKNLLQPGYSFSNGN